MAVLPRARRSSLVRLRTVGINQLRDRFFGRSVRARTLGSAGCQPALVGSLPTRSVFGKLPNTAGKLPALPEKMNGQDARWLHSQDGCATRRLRVCLLSCCVTERDAFTSVN